MGQAKFPVYKAQRRANMIMWFLNIYFPSWRPKALEPPTKPNQPTNKFLNSKFKPIAFIAQNLFLIQLRRRAMVNLVAAQRPLLHALMKMAGVIPYSVEIEPGTVMNFWVPIDTLPKPKKGQESKPAQKPTKPVVVLVHGFAAEGIVTWQFQVLNHHSTQKLKNYFLNTNYMNLNIEVLQTINLEHI